MAGISPGIVPLTRDQIGPASEVLVRAFFHDPKLTNILPDEKERMERGRSLFVFELRYGLNYGLVYATSSGLEGVAVWLPSDRSEFTLWRAMRSGGMVLRKGLGREGMRRLRLFSDQVDAYHHRHLQERHCYLFFIGVDPSFQGRGYGAKLIRPVLDWMDRRQVTCYLNTQNEMNIGLYEHFGFSVVEKAALPGSAIIHTGMIRYPITRDGGTGPRRDPPRTE